MFALVLALVMSTCPITLGIGTDGGLYSNRFHGWYEVSAKTVASDLRGGCYNDANPLAVTSVKLFIAPDAPKAAVDRVFSVLEKEGWSREKLTVEKWRNYPFEPSLD